MKQNIDTKNILRQLALDAKNRLKHCTYKNKEENQSIKRSLAFQNKVYELLKKGRRLH